MHCWNFFSYDTGKRSLTQSPGRDRFEVFHGFRKWNTPKANIGFGLMMSALRTSLPWSKAEIGFGLMLSAFKTSLPWSKENILTFVSENNMGWKFYHRLYPICQNVKNVALDRINTYTDLIHPTCSDLLCLNFSSIISTDEETGNLVCELQCHQFHLHDTISTHINRLAGTARTFLLLKTLKSLQ